MKWVLLNLFMFVATTAHAGDILFVDLNDSGGEVKACEQGMEAGNDDNQTMDSLFLVGAHSPVNADTIDKKLSELEAKGYNVDSIVISGHDGSGHFFGFNGRILASELRTVVAKHPKVKESLNNMALWGCYTATDNACTNIWNRQISPNIHTTIGFTLQAPDNTKPGDARLLGDYCRKRYKVASAQTEKEITDQFNGLDNIRNWNVGICMKDGLCSYDYNKKGDTTCYHSYAELDQRCGEMKPSPKMALAYEKYLTAAEREYGDPPSTDDDGPQPKNNIIRNFYGRANMWRHCASQYETETGYTQPAPSQIIRLIEFQTVKENFARIHARELAQYNAKLRELGMEQFTLDPLAKMSRAEIVASTTGAVAALSRISGRTLAPVAPIRAGEDEGEQNAVRPNPKAGGQPLEQATALLTMARGFDLSLRQLDWRCTDYSLVHEGATAHSPCIADYGVKPAWP